MPAIKQLCLALVLGVCAASSRAWGCVPPQSQPKPIDITSLTAAPNPALASQAITISGVVKTAEEKNELYACLDFGDGASASFYGDRNWDELKAVQHTYATAGVYTVTLYASTPRLYAESYLYIVVGRGNVCNPINGIFQTATDNSGLPRYAGGTTNVKINADKVYASRVSTEFQDIPGRSATMVGPQVWHTYTQRGIYRATSDAQSSGGSSLGKCRKMLNISSKDTGDSAALADPPSADIRMKKMQAKLSFAKSDPDKLSFSGEIRLPANFNPAAPNGIEVSVGIGNIVDTITVDEKGKATGPSVKGIITKLGIKFPKAGSDVALVSVSLALPDMDTAAMDTEGITSSVRSDERTLKAVDRSIQVDMLVAGVAYETYAPVQYKLAKPKKGETTSASGQFKGVPGRSPQQQ